MKPRASIADLIAKVAQQDRAALSALYAATAPQLFAITLSILKDTEAAELVLQEAYVKIWHNAAHFPSDGYAPMTWLITVARNHAIDTLRAVQAQPGGPDDIPDAPDVTISPHAVADAPTEQPPIEACLEAMEPDRAAAIRAAYVHGLGYEDLARRYGRPTAAIENWIRSSLLNLRERLTS